MNSLLESPVDKATMNEVNTKHSTHGSCSEPATYGLRFTVQLLLPTTLLRLFSPLNTGKTVYPGLCDAQMPLTSLLLSWPSFHLLYPSPRPAIAHSGDASSLPQHQRLAERALHPRLRLQRPGTHDVIQPTEFLHPAIHPHSAPAPIEEPSRPRTERSAGPPSKPPPWPTYPQAGGGSRAPPGRSMRRCPTSVLRMGGSTESTLAASPPPPVRTKASRTSFDEENTFAPRNSPVSLTL